MNICLKLLIIAIYISSCRARVDSALGIGRLKRSLWLEDPLFAVQEPKYSWFCRECSFTNTGAIGWDFVKSCDREAALNGVEYDLKECTGRQMCEVLQKTDPNEKPAWPVESMQDESGAPGFFTDIAWHRYCCDIHEICNLRMSDYAIEVKCYGEWFSEFFRRSCCQLEGLSCERPLVGMEGFISSYCPESMTCLPTSENISPEPPAQCCMMGNLSCTLPACEGPDVCATRLDSPADCLRPLGYGYCCEFLKLCEKDVCD